MGHPYFEIEPASLSARSVRPADLLPWVLFACIATFWALLYAFTTPDLAGPDTFVFSDAGCNWAARQGLLALSLPTANYPSPVLFADYTPGSPLLFGIAARLFGCSPYTDTYYNFAFGVLASILILHLYFQAEDRASHRLVAALLVGAVVPAGFGVNIHGRPEGPAFCLLTALLLAWRRTARCRTKALLAGMSGFVFLIHPFAGVVALLLFGFLLVFEDADPAMCSLKDKLLVAVIGGLVCAVLIGAVVLWMQHLDRSALPRFLNHALGAGTGAGIVLKATEEGEHLSALARYREGLSWNFNSNNPLAALPIISLAAVSLFLVLRLARRESSLSLRLQCVSLLGIFVIFPVALFPAQLNYFSFTRGLLLIVVLLDGFGFAREFQRKNLLPFMVLIFLFTAPESILNLLHHLETRTSYEHELRQPPAIRKYFAQQGIANPALLVDAPHYFLFKPYFARLYCTDYIQTGESSKLYDGMALCFAGKRAFAHSAKFFPKGLDPSDWLLVENGDDIATRITLFGMPLMRANWSWSCDIYRRTR